MVRAGCGGESAECVRVVSKDVEAYGSRMRNVDALGHDKRVEGRIEYIALERELAAVRDGPEIQR